MILGLDISSSSTGYGILNEPKYPGAVYTDSGVEVIAFGQIRPPVNKSHGEKYAFIAYKIAELSKQYDITDVIIESYFVSKVMGQSTFICAECRGAIKAAIAMFIPKAILHPEIAPSSLKKIITGNGRAGKIEVAKSILDKLNIQYADLKGNESKATFMIGEDKYWDDATDALSLAYCHYLKGVK